MAERRASQAKETRLSADVEPFVPKQQIIGMRWTESSSTPLPRYLTTCYPFVQDPYVDGQHLHAPENGCSKFSQNFTELHTSYPVMSSDLPVDYSLYYSYKQSADSSLNPFAQAFLHSEDICSSKHKYNGSSRGNKKKRHVQQDSEKERLFLGQSSKEARSKKELKNQGQNVNELPETGEQLQRPDVLRDNITKSGNKQVNKHQHSKSKPPLKILNEPEPKTDITSKVASGDFPEMQSVVAQQFSHDLRKSKESSKVSEQPAKVWPADDTTKMDEALSTSEPSGFPVNSEKCTVTTIGSVATSSLPISSTATPSVLSWATIVSQAPKRPVLSSAPPKIPAHKVAQRNEDETKLKEATGKVKKKKKKKKPKEPDEPPKQIESKITVQELPRLEDDEEFPDLASAVNTSDKTGNAGQSKFFANKQVVKRQFETSMDRELVLHVTSSHGTGDGPICLDRDQKAIQILRKESIQENRTTSPLKNSTEVPKKSGKKSKIPMQLDFGNMLTVLEQKQQEKSSKHTPKPIVFAVGGAFPMVPKEPTSKRLPQSSSQEKVPHNPLDSSAPLVKRGKQREVPKAKKPTSLKKIILKEREERKQRRLLEEKGLVPSSCNITSPHEAHTLDQNVTLDTQNEMTELNDSTEDLTNSAPSSPCQNVQPLSDAPKIPDEIWTKNILPHPNHQKIHSRRFREYCSQVLSKEVDNYVTDLLKELVRFQDRLYQKDPIKAKKKRRIVMGLREVLKHLKLKKLKCVIISPNCERIQSKGGLDEALHTIIEVAREQEIPFVFALSRRALGRCVNKAVPVSVVGIFSYDGAENQFHQMVELTEEARKAYQEMLNALEQEIRADEGNSVEPLCNLSEESTSALDSMTPQSFTEPSEPEYVTTWRNLLKRECNSNLSDTENTRTSDSPPSDAEETGDSIQAFPKSILDFECQTTIR
ncbi:selenocysteine insertion sequence-binding protein 2-like isoform X2 [Pristis pectinata]|uniref:selenocysteine insertion sequence-binding protein 2-like isoform X2 n=1 Tax=Pristis pectinata TaxID=685728 RepID=UPI00223CCF34|nr:selenocysteine insertion sequence-binding protein 2-like isoform X2 [Pristis pectinata]